MKSQNFVDMPVFERQMGMSKNQGPYPCPSLQMSYFQVGTDGKCVKKEGQFLSKPTNWHIIDKMA